MRSSLARLTTVRHLRLGAAFLAAALLAACSSDTITSSATPGITAPSAPSYYTYPSAIYRSHVEFGIPTDGSPSNDLLLSKRINYISYNCARGGPNWVSWNLNKTHYGDAARSTSFTSDATLPSSCSHITTSDYTNSGYSRGHMTRSEERTWSSDDNKQTFLMTNILPQYQDLNGGPWYKLELYLQDLAQNQNKELYVISGGYGSRGTLSGLGKVTIPTRNYKIVVIMPYGQGLANATSTSSIQVLAVDMPNVTGISANTWQTYSTTVDAIEAATGYNFLDKLTDSVENYWEARKY
jgi:endonuclease G, mitochondrial